MDEDDVFRHHKKVFKRKTQIWWRYVDPIWLNSFDWLRYFVQGFFYWISSSEFPHKETSPQTNFFLFQAVVPEDNGNAVGFLNCSLKGLGVKPIKPNFLQLSSDRASFCNTCTKATLARGFLVTWSTEALIGSHNCLPRWESWVSRS